MGFRLASSAFSSPGLCSERSLGWSVICGHSRFWAMRCDLRGRRWSPGPGQFSRSGRATRPDSASSSFTKAFDTDLEKNGLVIPDSFETGLSVHGAYGDEVCR
jgi:hypothetical protein